MPPSLPRFTVRFNTPAPKWRIPPRPRCSRAPKASGRAELLVGRAMALTLHYFPLRARAEPLKMILGHCKISYVDRQVPFAEWGAWKASGSVPPGKTGGVQLPVLELEDGTLLPESLDIAKHVWTLAGKQVTGAADLLWALNDKRDGPFNSPDFVVAGLVNPLLNWFSAEDAAPKIPPHVAGFPAFFEYLAPLLDEEPGPFFGGAEPSYGKTPNPNPDPDPDPDPAPDPNPDPDP